MNPKYIKQIHYREEKKIVREKMETLIREIREKMEISIREIRKKMGILVREIRENYLEKALGTLCKRLDTHLT